MPIVTESVSTRPKSGGENYGANARKAYLRLDKRGRFAIINEQRPLWIECAAQGQRPRLNEPTDARPQTIRNGAKRRMKKAYLLFFLVVGLVMLSVGTAAAETATEVIVGGETLDGVSVIYATTDALGVVTLQPAYSESDPWNIKFKDGVLTLRNATVAGVARPYDSISMEEDIGIYAEGELYLVLEGGNEVFSRDGADIRAGIYIRSKGGTNNASLTISGGGSLHAYAAAGGNHVHYGICVSGSMTMHDATVTAEGRSTDGNSYGVFTTNDFRMKSGTLTAIGGDVSGGSYLMSCGVIAGGKVSLSGGTLIATGGTGTMSSFGVSSGAVGGITISPSTGGQVKVTAKTTDAADNYRRAFNRAPIISNGASYTWTLTEGDPNPTPSTTAPYAWADTQRFTELVLDKKLAMPDISPAAGTYPAPQNVTLSCTTPGATIRYTLDGTDPTMANGTDYVAAFPISTSCTVKARAFKTGMSQSNVAAADFSISHNVDVSGGVGGGMYAEGGPVTITADAPAADMRFDKWVISPAVTFTAGSANTATATFTMPTQDVTATATYTERRYAIDAQPSDPAFGSVTGGGSYLLNAAVTLKAVASKGYHFVKWMENGADVGTANPLTLVASTDRALTAVFESDTPTPPITGDEAPLALLMALALSAFLSILLLLSRRRLVKR